MNINTPIELGNSLRALRHSAGLTIKQVMDFSLNFQELIITIFSLEL